MDVPSERSKTFLSRVSMRYHAERHYLSVIVLVVDIVKLFITIWRQRYLLNPTFVKIF